LPLVNAHIAADQQALAGEEPQAVDAKEVLSDGLPAIFMKAHQQRNHARLTTSTPLSAEKLAELEDGLARLRVHLSLLALGSVKQRDEP
ncbi:hypothetical protein R0K18_29680, partial [Pantoea sp. SIMBA_133]